ncbi:MAG: serine/threonine-protein phosphatase [Mycoplasmataceae bacterium]|nr:serine/threonine-protein phosphatase [Mycoplasmataceae bacterium]
MEKNNICKFISTATEKGVRFLNEDTYGVLEKKTSVFCLVCDGIGGRKHSEYASQILRDTIMTSYKKSWFLCFPTFIKKCIRKSIKKMINFTKTKTDVGKIGTTLVGAYIHNKNCVKTCSVGDSRIFHFSQKNKQWKQITTDQNLKNFLWEKTQEKITNAPDKKEFYEQQYQSSLIQHQQELTYLTNSVDNETTFDYKKIEFSTIEIESGDYVFLCSDGVYNWISLDEAAKIIEEHKENSSQKIIDFCLTNKSNDNLTAIVVQIN